MELYYQKKRAVNCDECGKGELETLAEFTIRGMKFRLCARCLNSTGSTIRRSYDKPENKTRT